VQPPLLEENRSQLSGSGHVEAPLNGTELLLCFACASVVSIAVEAVKWLVRRGRLHAP